MLLPIRKNHFGGEGFVATSFCKEIVDSVLIIKAMGLQPDCGTNPGAHHKNALDKHFHDFFNFEKSQ